MSHNVMSAFWSAQDKADQKASRYFGVIGKIFDATPATLFTAGSNQQEKVLDLFEIFDEEVDKLQEDSDYTITEEMCKNIEERAYVAKTFNSSLPAVKTGKGYYGGAYSGSYYDDYYSGYYGAGSSYSASKTKSHYTFLTYKGLYPETLSDFEDKFIEFQECSHYSSELFKTAMASFSTHLSNEMSSFNLHPDFNMDIFKADVEEVLLGLVENLAVVEAYYEEDLKSLNSQDVVESSEEVIDDNSPYLDGYESATGSDLDYDSAIFFFNYKGSEEESFKKGWEEGLKNKVKH